MTKFIKPYQYNIIEEQAITITTSQRSVNDKQTVATLKALAIEKIMAEFPEATAEQKELLTEPLNLGKAQRDLERYLMKVKTYVIPFKVPSDKGLQKVFAKTKKLSIPKWEEVDLAHQTFYGWNDSGKQRKYLISYQDDKLVGLEGALSPDVKKGICAICHGTSGVSLFMAKGKVSKEGNYLTKGNYICHNSDTCNRQLQSLDELARFLKIVTPKK